MDVMDQIESDLFVPEVVRYELPPHLRSLLNWNKHLVPELQYQMLVTELEMSSLDPVKETIPNIFDHLHNWLKKIEKDFEENKKEGNLLLEELKLLNLTKLAKSLEKLLNVCFCYS